MVFCNNCGEKLNDGAKFCLACGAPTDFNQHNNNTTRKSVYDGEIHKCPQCGEVLNSFVTVCPVCGYELRGSSATSAIKEFVTKLDNATTKYQKANIICGFPIPNTKEDIFEFMILTSSNIDERLDKEVFDAWIAKF